MSQIDKLPLTQNRTSSSQERNLQKGIKVALNESQSLEKKEFNEKLKQKIEALKEIRKSQKEMENEIETASKNKNLSKEELRKLQEKELKLSEQFNKKYWETSVSDSKEFARLHNILDTKITKPKNLDGLIINLKQLAKEETDKSAKKDFALLIDYLQIVSEAGLQDDISGHSIDDLGIKWRKNLLETNESWQFCKHNYELYKKQCSDNKTPGNQTETDSVLTAYNRLFTKFEEIFQESVVLHHSQDKKAVVGIVSKYKELLKEESNIYKKFESEDTWKRNELLDPQTWTGEIFTQFAPFRQSDLFHQFQKEKGETNLEDFINWLEK